MDNEFDSFADELNSGKEVKVLYLDGNGNWKPTYLKASTINITTGLVEKRKPNDKT